MAIPVFDAVTAPAHEATVDTLNFAHTCAGSDRALMVGLSVDSPITSPTATYNAVSMALVSHLSTPATTPDLLVFKLADPAVGSNTVALNWTGTFNAGAIATSYTGVNQDNPAGPEQTENSGTGTGTSSSVVITSDTTELVFSCLTVNNLTTGVTIGGDLDDERADTNGGAGAVQISTADGAGVSSFTSSHTWTGDQRFRQIVVGLRVPDDSADPILTLGVAY